MKKCLYCSERINDENEYQKIGKKFCCNFCYEDYLDEMEMDYYWVENNDEINMDEY